MSSANNLGIVLVELCKSLTHHKNNNGPNVDPGGTAKGFVINEDCVLFMETNCFLSRKDFFNLRVWPCML